MNMYECTYVCMYVRKYVYVCVCMYIVLKVCILKCACELSSLCSYRKLVAVSDNNVPIKQVTVTTCKGGYELRSFDSFIMFFFAFVKLRHFVRKRYLLAAETFSHSENEHRSSL